MESYSINRLTIFRNVLQHVRKSYSCIEFHIFVDVLVRFVDLLLKKNKN